MKFSTFLFMTLGLAAAAASPIVAQRPNMPTTKKPNKVYGNPYKVPNVRVYLTDGATGDPLAEKVVMAKYCWGWDVLTRTALTDRMPRIECTEIKRRTDIAGVVILPSILLTPSRPEAPAGSELSEPRFQYAGLIVRDEKHDSYLSVFDSKVNLLDANGEVHRTVPLYPRPKP